MGEVDLERLLDAYKSGVLAYDGYKIAETKDLELNAREALAAEVRRLRAEIVDRADTEQSLTNELAKALNQADRWVSVEERLPETREGWSCAVMVLIDYRPEGGYRRTLARLVPYDAFKEQDLELVPWKADTGPDYGLRYEPVTHWMPLPDPPGGSE